MSILTKLSVKNLKLNKKRTIGTIIGIVLSVALICAVAGMFGSFQKTLVQNTINETGYYHYGLPNIDPATLKTVESNRLVANIMTTYELGTAFLEIPDQTNTFMYVRSTDYLDDLPYELKSGKKPTASNEIMIPNSLAINSELKIGDTLELDLGTRMTIDGYPLRPSNPYHKDEEGELVGSVHKTYTIVGTYTGPSTRIYHPNYYDSEESSTFYLGLTTKETSDDINAFVALADPKKAEDFLQSLYATGKFSTPEKHDADLYTINPNYELFRWETFQFGDTTITMLYTVVAIVIGIIVATSIFCIRNSFAISTTEKQKMLGMLASIGATRKQIKKSVLAEAFILGLIGIPLGILSGLFADFVLIKIVNSILKDYLFANIDGLIFTISLPACIIAAILGTITIYFSAISSARKASKISPIDNMRSSKDITLTAQNMRTPRIIQNIFKTGGVLAYKNLKRSKKKYRTTVISLAVSVFIFIAMNSFLTETFKLTNTFYTEYDYNVIATNVQNLNEEDIDQIRTLDNIDALHIVYEVITEQDDYLNIYDTAKINIIDNEELICDTYEKVTYKCLEGPHMSLLMLALDDTTFREYVSDLGLEYEDTKSKGILVDEITTYDYDSGKTSLMRRYKYQGGDTIEATFHGEDFKLEIATVTTHKPYGIEDYSYSGGFLIVDRESFEDISFVPYVISIESSNSEQLTTDLNKNNSSIVVTNLESAQKSSKAMILVVSIFLYGFIAVITLIGVTNIFNTITSNMELRSKEFAMLKSIGMTKREFSRMINLETLFYSAKSLIYGIIFGLLGAYALHKAFGIRLDTTFEMPFSAIAISIVFVFILVSIIMRFSLSKIDAQNTIETIRKDNI